MPIIPFERGAVGQQHKHPSRFLAGGNLLWGAWPDAPATPRITGQLARPIAPDAGERTPGANSYFDINNNSAGRPIRLAARTVGI